MGKEKTHINVVVIGHVDRCDKNQSVTNYRIALTRTVGNRPLPVLPHTILTLSLPTLTSNRSLDLQVRRY